jgi:hypothetical protein
MYLKIRDSERVGGTHGRRRQRTDIDVVLDRPGLRALHADGLRPWNVAVDNGLVGRVRFVFFVSLTGHLHVSVLHGGHRHRFQHRQETRPDRTDHRTAGHARRRPHRRRRCRRRYLEPATETVRPIPTTYRPTYCFSNSTLSVDWSGMFLETIT